MSGIFCKIAFKKVKATQSFRIAFGSYSLKNYDAQAGSPTSFTKLRAIASAPSWSSSSS